jgi:hypothetical protein
MYILPFLRAKNTQKFEAIYVLIYNYIDGWNNSQD